MISIFLSPRSTFVVRMRDGSPGRVEGWPVGGHCWQGLSELILMLDATLRVELMNAGDPWTRPRSDEITAISRSGREADRIFAVNDEMNMLERCSLSIQKRSLTARCCRCCAGWTTCIYLSGWEIPILEWLTARRKDQVSCVACGQVAKLQKFGCQHKRYAYMLHMLC